VSDDFNPEWSRDELVALLMEFPPEARFSLWGGYPNAKLTRRDVRPGIDVIRSGPMG